MESLLERLRTDRGDGAMGVWSPENEQTLLEPFTYLTATPGKEVRSQLIDAFDAWLHLPKPSVELVKQVVGMLHSASLLMDDVEDDSSLRRGIPVAHKIYGVPQTINSANYVYFLAYQRLSKLATQKASQMLDDVNGAVVLGPPSLTAPDELLRLHRGQGMDLFWRESLTCPTEDEYIEMVNNKTGGLFRIAIKLMIALSESLPADHDYVPLVNLVGILFQIRDDYMNLQSDQYAANKGFAEDLTEGKFSFPIVHSIRADRGNTRILNLLRQRPTDDAMKHYAVDYMRTQTGSFAYTRSVLAQLQTQARAEIDRLGGNPALVVILDLLVVELQPGDEI